jgi:hypothetical protein
MEYYACKIPTMMELIIIQIIGVDRQSTDVFPSSRLRTVSCGVVREPPRTPCRPAAISYHQPYSVPLQIRIWPGSEPAAVPSLPASPEPVTAWIGVGVGWPDLQGGILKPKSKEMHAGLSR